MPPFIRSKCVSLDKVVQEVLESFMLSKLSEELKELHGDRKGVHENFKKMEEFVVGALAKEIKEFHEDKKGVVETKVKL